MGYKWIPVSLFDKERIPKSAFIGGYDSDDSPLYVGRVLHDGNQLAAKVRRDMCYVSYKGQEISKDPFEILCGMNFEWESFQGTIPPTAVPSGRNSKYEKLYIGRVSHVDSLTIGRIDAAHGCIYIPYGGEEHIYYREFEILTNKNVRE